MVTASRDWAVTWAVIELWHSRDWAVIELWPHCDWAVTQPWLSCDLAVTELWPSLAVTEPWSLGPGAVTTMVTVSSRSPFIFSWDAFRSMSIGLPIPEIEHFQNLTLKIQGQGQRTMMLHKYRPRQFHWTSDGMNPSSGFREMGSAKSGPSAAWFHKFLAHGQAHMGQKRK